MFDLSVLALCLHLLSEDQPSAELSSTGIAAHPANQYRSRTNADERWLEVIEIYTVPFDPHWRDAVQGAATSFHLTFPEANRELNERKDAVNRRADRAKSEDKDRIRRQGDAELQRKRQKLIDTLTATKDRIAPISIMRAWDGIAHAEVLLAFGQGQRGILERFRPKKPILAAIGVAAPGEDWQAPRTSVRAIRSSAKAPTDFALAHDSPADIDDLAFGEVKVNARLSNFAIQTQKDPKPGSGVIALSMRLPSEGTPIDQRFPWYVEFELYELDKEGHRGAQVKFEGANAVVALPTHQNRNPLVSEDQGPAFGYIEVRSPKPWGYQAIATKWFGVAPKEHLVSVATPSAGDSQTAPSPATQPLEETAAPPLPEEPTTPEVPSSS